MLESSTDFRLFVGDCGGDEGRNSPVFGNNYSRQVRPTGEEKQEFDGRVGSSEWIRFDDSS